MPELNCPEAEVTISDKAVNDFAMLFVSVGVVVELASTFLRAERVVDASASDALEWVRVMLRKTEPSPVAARSTVRASDFTRVKAVVTADATVFGMPRRMAGAGVVLLSTMRAIAFRSV